jgi:superfamily II DNA helicase RecQ
LSLHQQIKIPIIACTATQTAPNIEKVAETVEANHAYRTQTAKITEAYNLNGGFAMENYIYDVITISNLLATVYRIL